MTTIFLTLFVASAALPTDIATEEPPEQVAEAPASLSGGLLDLAPHLRGFAAVDLSFYGSDPLGFGLDDFVLAYDANLDERIQLAAEVSYELAATGDVPPEVELLTLSAQLTDQLSLSAGRMRNPMSPWATRGTHGSYRWAAFDIPEVLTSEHEGGPLPLHLVGLSLQAHADLGYWRTGVEFVASNGRSSYPLVVPTDGDTSWEKALLARAWVTTPGALTMAIGGYYDHLVPPGAVEDLGSKYSGIALEQRVREGLLSASVSVDTRRLEVLGELWLINHRTRRSVVWNTASYLQIGPRFGRWQPFVRGETINIAHDDPIHALFGNARAEGKGVSGVRWDFARHAALKVQGEGILESSHQAVRPGPRELRAGFHVQLAAGF